MKKAVAVLLIAVMALSFIACSSIKKEELVGTWEVTSANAENGDALVGTIMTFDEDNQYKWTMGNYTLMSGEYKISGTYVYLDKEKELFTINGNTLTVKDASGEMTLIKK